MRATRATGSSSTSAATTAMWTTWWAAPPPRAPTATSRAILVELACRRQVPVLLGGAPTTLAPATWWATDEAARQHAGYHEAREMPVNPRILVQTNSNFMQTRGNLATAIKVMRAADTLRVLRDQVLAHGPVRRHHPAGVHPLGGQRRRVLGRAVLAEPVWRRQRPEAAQGTPCLLEAPGEADVRGPRGEARLPRDHRAHGV